MNTLDVEHSLNGSTPKVDEPDKFKKEAERLNQAARNLLNKVHLQKGIKEKQIETLEGKVNWRLRRRDIHISDGNYSLNDLSLMAKAYEELQEATVALRKLRQYLPKREKI